MQGNQSAYSMKKIILTLLLCICFQVCAAPTSMQEKLSHAKVGDFIVTAQEGNYSLLCVRSIAAETLVLEEISVPCKQVDLKTVQWKKWAAEKAPGHTSWTLYEIERSTGKLIECFSYSKNGWLYLDESEQFLTRLIALPLTTVPWEERKKIGPQPGVGESDRRAVWNPSLVVEGKKVSKAAFEVLKTTWPDDGSRLSLCNIELYFSEGKPEFPFPYWLEVQSPHYTFKMRTIDSGHDLISSMRGQVPHRSPLFLGNAQKGKDTWKLFIKTPSYFQRMHLFVSDITEKSSASIPLRFTMKKGSKNEEVILEVSSTDLRGVLKSGHQYQWVLIPEGSANIYVESEEVFTWQR